MAAASNHSPQSSGSISDPSSAFNSPRSKRAMPVRGGAVPWPQLVHGAESESIVAEVATDAHSPLAMGAARGPIDNYSPDRSPSKTATVSYSSSSSMSSLDHSAGEAAQADSDNGGGSINEAKKQVWNKPSNGAAEVGPVMGAVSWPALSESTRASPKSASSDSFKPTSDPLVHVSQGTGITSSTTPSLVTTNNANPTVTPPTRQKSMKKVSGSSSGSVTSNGSLPQLPPPPWSPVTEMPFNNAGRSGLVVPESSPRDHSSKESGQRGGFGSQSHGGSDHPQQRNSFRRGNGGGPYPRGDGSFYQNYRGRRDQDGGSHEWNSHRSFSGRDPYMHPQRVVPRGFIRPSPHTSTTFIPPPPVPVQPFGNHIIYPEMPASVIYVPAPPPDSFRGVPVMAQMTPHAMFFSMPDQLRLRIISQIDYYFSNENLIRDIYLRQNMDEQGWVPINLIAGFAKVKLLTSSIALILDALRFSNIVEVKDDKVRKRDDWWRWIMPSAQFPNISSRSSQDMLAANIQSMSLADTMNKQGQEEGFLSRSSSGDFSSQSQRSSGGERTGQATFQSGEPSISARSK